jgi:heme/copper-type cytochrome/quinol oxidase subunit 2
MAADGLLWSIGRLAFLHLGFYGEIWATIPYSIFLGIALFIYVIVIIVACLTAWLLRRSTREEAKAAEQPVRST